MAQNLSAQEVRAAKMAAMPAPLGALHYELWTQVAWVHMKWQEYRAFFGKDRETVDFLNDVAPAFFHHLQSVLWDDVLLHLCRLTDPPKSAGKDNLTLTCLPAVIPDPELRGEVQALVDVSQQRTSFARDWRNRRLAHTELPCLTGAKTTALAAASRQHVENALKAIRAVMNCVEQHYQKSSVMYEEFIEPLGSSASVLFYLRKGLEAQRRDDEALLALKTKR
jgi:hypothetical protein